MYNITLEKIIYTCFFILLLTNCKSDEVVNNNNSVKDFTWKAMNSWYNWQTSVSSLDDSKDDNNTVYTNFLNDYSSPEVLFESLIYQEGTVDRFSWFIEDYIAQQQQFQGIATTFGIRTSSLIRIPATDYLILYIKYVTPGSPAHIAGFKRGDIINGFNGTTMTVNNYKTVVNNYYSDTTEFYFSENDGITFKDSKEITQAVVSDNPVYLAKTFDNINGKKVGYLVYNGFRSSYNDELNAAFAEFSSSNIDELILDFRINGGGSVETCAYLASMIHKEANSDIFAELKFNSKHGAYDGAYNFGNTLDVYDAAGNKTTEQTINRLTGLNKIYVLTSDGTASASEMIINGLKPFIEVKTVGTTTYGKNVGSITLYDSPASDYLNVDTANSSHTNAMQPIVFQIFNKLGESDYTQGFTPDILVEEWNYWNNILPFGDENEVVLKAALDAIRGISNKSLFSVNPSEKIAKNLSSNKFEKEMYINSSFFK